MSFLVQKAEWEEGKENRRGARMMSDRSRQ